MSGLNAVWRAALNVSPAAMGEHHAEFSRFDDREKRVILGSGTETGGNIAESYTSIVFLFVFPCIPEACTVLLHTRDWQGCNTHVTPHAAWDGSGSWDGYGMDTCSCRCTTLQGASREHARSAHTTARQRKCAERSIETDDSSKQRGKGLAILPGTRSMSSLWSTEGD